MHCSLFNIIRIHLTATDFVNWNVNLKWNTLNRFILISSNFLILTRYFTYFCTLVYNNFYESISVYLHTSKIFKINLWAVHHISPILYLYTSLLKILNKIKLKFWKNFTWFDWIFVQCNRLSFPGFPNLSSVSELWSFV